MKIARLTRMAHRPTPTRSVSEDERSAYLADASGWCKARCHAVADFVRSRAVAAGCVQTSREICYGPARNRSYPTLALVTFGLIVVLAAPATTALSQERPNSPARVELPSMFSGGPSAWTSPEGLTSSLQIMLTLTVLSMAPAVLLMTTSFIRIIIVLSLLRQALGTQQLPPSQVITSIALFLTLAIMSPVWKQAYDDGIKPYTERKIGLDEAWTATMRPVRNFMSAQIDRTGNSDDIWLFLKYAPDEPTPQSYDEVPLTALLPAFMLSELKTSFLIGFQIYLPFLILDMVISSVMISMGMMMLPPVLISLPLKLLLFVLADGWHLTIGMLIESFG